MLTFRGVLETSCAAGAPDGENFSASFEDDDRVATLSLRPFRWYAGIDQQAQALSFDCRRFP
jgi:hypothetical protein